MVKKSKQVSQVKLMRVSTDNLDFLGTLCTKKGMSYDDALLRLIRTATKSKLKEMLLAE